MCYTYFEANLMKGFFLMGNKKFVAGYNTNLLKSDSAPLVKGAILLGSVGLALLLSGDKNKKKSKKKNKSFVAKTKDINGKINALCEAFYVYDIKKNGERDGFPVKMETADIIEI